MSMLLSNTHLLLLLLIRVELDTWQNLIVGIDMNYSSRKVWYTIRRINHDNTTKSIKIDIRSNRTTNYLLMSGKVITA